MFFSKLSLTKVRQVFSDLPYLLYPPQIKIESSKSPPVPPYISYGIGGNSLQVTARSGSPPTSITSECFPCEKLNPETTRSLAMNKNDNKNQ